MNHLFFGLFLVGILVAICGWFFDRALDIRWVSRLVAPEYVHGTAFLDRLEGNDKLAVTADHRGCPELLRRWPGLSNTASVRMVSRSVAFMQFGTSVAPDIQLIARAQDQSEIPPRWSMAAARKELGDEAKNRAFWVGAVVFFLGMAISLVAGTLQFLEAERQERLGSRAQSETFAAPSNNALQLTSGGTLARCARAFIESPLAAERGVNP